MKYLFKYPMFFYSSFWISNDFCIIVLEGIFVLTS